MQEKPYPAAVCNSCGSADDCAVHSRKEWNFGHYAGRDASIGQGQNCKVCRRIPEIVDDDEAESHSLSVDQGQTIHPPQLYHFADLMAARLRHKRWKKWVLETAATLGFADGLNIIAIPR